MLGDKGDKFYIILNGTVQILKYVKNTMKLTAEEYYLTLNQMYLKGEKDLLKKTIKKNNTIFSVDKEDDIRIIKEIILKVKFKKTLVSRKKIEDLKILFEENCKNPLDFGINFEQIEKNTVLENYKLFFKKYQEYSCDDDILHYRSIENEKEKKNVIIYEYYLFLTLKSGDFFGDFAFDNLTNESTATVKSNSDCHLCYIDSETYNYYILKEKQKLKSKEITFLINNFFFPSVKFSIFEKKFYPHIIIKKLKRNQVLFVQNDELDKIYFIKSGEIELTINSSIIDLNNMLKILMKNNFPENFKDLSDSENSLLFLKLVNNSFIDQYYIKKKIKILLYGQKEVLGLIEYKLNINRLITAKVISENSKVFTLEKDVKKYLKLDF